MIRILGLFCVLMVVGMMTGCSKPEGDKEYQYKFPAWTPDGKIVAVRRTIVTYPDGGGFGGGGYGGYEEYHLVKFNDDGSGEQTIKEVGYDAGYISVSTSSNYIGYAVNNYINIIDWGGNQVDSIPTGVDGNGQRFDWSPNENYIVFEKPASSQDQGFIYDIYIYNLVDKTSNKMFDKSVEPSWKKNNKFAYINPNEYLTFSNINSDVITTNVSLYGKFSPQYIDQGNKIIYFDNKIYIYDLNSEVIISSNIGLTNYWNLDVSSDAIKIVFDIEHKHVGVINVDGTSKRQIK